MKMVIRGGQVGCAQEKGRDRPWMGGLGHSGGARTKERETRRERKTLRMGKKASVKRSTREKGK